MFATISLCFYVLHTMKSFFQVSILCCLFSYTLLKPGTLSFRFIFETGWSHFAQFTIAVSNKDPKKSKHSGYILHLLISLYRIYAVELNRVF